MKVVAICYMKGAWERPRRPPGDHVRDNETAADSGVPAASFKKPAPRRTEFDCVHGFDTEHRDLHNAGFVLELRERGGSFLVVADRSSAADSRVRGIGRAEVSIDRCWATRILTGAMSPLAALEHRLGRPLPRLVESARGLAGGLVLKRIDSRPAEQAVARLGPATVRPFALIRRASGASTARR